MSNHGPQNADRIRIAVKPLLDSIAPEYIFNQLAVLENRAARLADPDTPLLAEEGWQCNFYDKKIRTALQLDVLDYNAWDEETHLDRAKDLFCFLFDTQATSKGLLDWVQDGIKKNALDYIRDIKAQATTKLGADWELNYSEPKAVAAFERMINVQIAFNFLEKIDSLKDHERDALLIFIRGKMPVQDFNDLKRNIQSYIETQTRFSVYERIMFRS